MVAKIWQLKARSASLRELFLHQSLMILDSPNFVLLVYLRDLTVIGKQKGVETAILDVGVPIGVGVKSLI